MTANTFIQFVSRIELRQVKTYKRERGKNLETLLCTGRVAEVHQDLRKSTNLPPKTGTVALAILSIFSSFFMLCGS